MAAPIAGAVQGDSRYEAYQESQNIFMNDNAFAPNDSNAAPNPLDNSIGGIFIRFRTNGDMVFWNGTSWAIINASTPIMFSVGDGQQYSPINGDTQYNNPNLAGKTGGLLIRNGLPVLNGINYIPSGGFEFNNGDTFHSGEDFVWLINSTINNIPPDYSQYVRRQNVATFSDVVVSGSERMIFVANDETNSNNKGMYYTDGTTLTWIPVIEL